MNEQQRGSGRDSLREGIRTAMGLLGALRDELEESLEDLKQKGEFSPDKAKEAVRNAMGRAQETMDGAKERLDFATRRDVESLREEFAELRRRVADLEAGGRALDIPIDE
jgi:polyhydroxyalkanoate synthesis regulator phasin